MSDAPRSTIADYLLAAFNFRPFGMYVAPNWVALGVAGLLGFVNPGFWLLGLAGEGLYLLALVQNGRFRALVDAHRAGASPAAERATAAIAALPSPDRARYERLRATAAAIVAEARPDEPEEARADRARLLERLTAVFVDLLVARQGLARARAAQDDTVPERLRALRMRLDETPPGDLHDSLADQAAVLARRAEAAEAARARAEWVDAELARLEDHAGLLRDQALLPGDHAHLGSDVDRLADRLAAADRWLLEQRALDGLAAGAPTDAPRRRPDQRVVR